MTAYYNEHDPYAAQWLRNLIEAGEIAPGTVDERSIEDVRPIELSGYSQCHFFAGIGAWSLALRRAGWPDERPVWTGSCPCQPFSASGKSAGFADERHLWPAFFHIIQQCQPAILLGEQVASKGADAWIDLVQNDLEGMGYAFGAVPFPSAGIGAPHIRERIYWVADADGWQPGDSNVQRGRQHGQQSQDRGFAGWRNVRRIRCSDGLVRPVEPDALPLAHGLAGRMGRMRAYGNAVNVEAAKAVIDAYMQHDSYSKDAESDSKNRNGSQTEACNPLTYNDNLAEWTGLEPATPGVTGRCAK